MPTDARILEKMFVSSGPSPVRGKRGVLVGVITGATTGAMIGAGGTITIGGGTTPGIISLLVIVHTLWSPFKSVTLPEALQSPLHALAT